MSAVSTRETAIVVDRLRVTRGGAVVLHDVCLEVPTGVVTGLLGPSGCGKSTLMRSIVGVQVVASGEVTVLDRPAGSEDLRSRIGYVTQSPSVYVDLTARENLRYFARLLDASTAAVDGVLRDVGLTELADRPVGALSGGQRSRVSLATALLGSPELLVLDEPTVGLDPVLRRDLWEMFHRLADDGCTLIVSSHVMDEAERCDHLVLMRDGRIVASESPGHLLERTGAHDIEDAFLRIVEHDGDRA